MDALNRSTTTRPLALAAMLVVAGVLFLRALSLFAVPPEPAPVGSPQEQRFIALLEPLIGADQVRASIQKDASGTLVWYVLIDGPAVPAGMKSGYSDMVSGIAAARGYDSARDRLEIVQRPFAKSMTGILSVRDIAELGGLGLVFLLLLGLILQRASETSRPADRSAHAPEQMPTEQAHRPINDNIANQAAILASAAPERSAALIRRWMQEDDR